LSFTVGSLVKTRGREWIVAENQGELLVLRPLGGSDEETTGVYLPLEKVEPAQFALPNPSEVGDHRSCRLLREAVRLSARAGAGPFRSLSRIAIEPRPYQLVPLLMALKLDPVRLLIADDVGIGKTIEACLIARELLDRGEVKRIAVLCPPHLAEQWQEELRDKFHIEAELVLASTAARLERPCALGQSLFELYPFVVVSLDFIKSERRRAEFLRSCPEFVIVDEAHTCSFGFQQRGHHQRYELVGALAKDPERHLVLVSATPHTGNEEAFRSLLGFLDPAFQSLPQDLAGPDNEPHRRKLAAHLVQRRRPDLERYLAVETHFPRLEDAETFYTLSSAYKEFFQKVLGYIRETTETSGLERRVQRVRWWSALALLRSVASSPAAAAATLRNRAPAVDASTPEEVDALGRKALLDLETDDETEGVDIAPGADPLPSEDSLTDAEKEGARRLREKLLRLAREADDLKGKKDAKLLGAVKLIETLLNDGFSPIVFCRFIPTAEYLASELRSRLPKGVEVACVTGLLPSEDREERVLALQPHEKRVLVCTDCLSEGINLQEGFDAVVHYDLSWSPTRHEQRQGRVNRFMQRKKIVRALTYYGKDNGIDGIVLDVLLRKHQMIRNRLGISVPVPTSTNAVIDAVLEGLVLREKTSSTQPLLPFLEECVAPRKEELHVEWERASEREKRSRTLFAQESIRVDEVAHELAASRDSIGSTADVSRFVLEGVVACAGAAVEKPRGFQVDVRTSPRALRDRMGVQDKALVRFDPPAPEGVEFWSRTHAAVQGLAEFVLEGALDIQVGGPARRAGAVRTRAVTSRTTLLLLRFRFDLGLQRGADGLSQLAEEVRLLAFRGAPDEASWLPEEEAVKLLEAEPDGNIAPEQASTFVSRVVEGHGHLRPRIEEEARSRASALLEAHQRVRTAARAKRLVWRVEPRLPADVIGIYVFLPAGASR